MTDKKSLSKQECGVQGKVSGCLRAEGDHFITLTGRRGKSEGADAVDG